MASTEQPLDENFDMFKGTEADVNLTDLGIELPSELANIIAEYDPEYETLTPESCLSCVYDQGESNSNLLVSANKGNIYLSDKNLKDFKNPDINKQICRLTIDDGRVTGISLSVPVHSFTLYLDSLGDGSSLINDLKRIVFPESYEPFIPGSNLNSDKYGRDAYHTAETLEFFENPNIQLINSELYRGRISQIEKKSDLKITGGTFDTSKDFFKLEDEGKDAGEKVD